jgi:hypothetical protein
MEKKNTIRDEYFTVTERGFWPKWLSKLLFTLISVKVWGLVACTWVSTYLICKGLIDKEQWVTFNTTIWALIFGMKEVFRVMDRKDQNEEKLINADNKTKENIARIKAEVVKTEAATPDCPPQTADGKEIVGDDPN